MKQSAQPCQSHSENIALLAAGALAAEEHDRVRHHLDTCLACRGYFAELSAVASPLKDWENSLKSVQPSPQARLRWAQAIESAAAKPPVTAAPAGISLIAILRNLFSPNRLGWSALTAVWLVMWSLHWGLAGTDSSASMATIATAVPHPPTMRTVADEQRLLAELISPPFQQPAEPPRRSAPPPRSSNQSGWRFS